MTGEAASAGARAVRRDRAAIVATAGAVVALCWALLISTHAPDSGTLGAVGHAHVHASGSAGLGLAFLMWVLMMVAMMLPAVMPWILLFARLRRGPSGAGTALSTTWFVSGYLAVWIAYAAAGAVAQVGLVEIGWLTGPDPRFGPTAAGAVLVGAGLFQLTPWKASCLRHCRSPLGFFLARWRDGPRGAFGMGLTHGLYCAGCCWALMAVGFALGVMNLIWMGALTLLLCVEKIVPGGALVGRLAGGGLAAWGLALVLRAQ